MNKIPDAIICLWKWDTKANRSYQSKWKLVEVYGINDNGYVVTPSKHAVDERETWIGWMNKKTYPHKGNKEDYEWEPIMGRAVTICSLQSGVRLIALHPMEWAEWIGIGFIERIRELPSWSLLLESGHTLLLDTEREARKLLFGEK